ncbi:glycerophosphodiester phosphodiesterase family protein [Streptomyces sp. NBC_01808]|uniref:glycerophosphodiester phosphodiesterase n=1 Tax=Streptomyces sp. NBC_01808 TaxID=2975947 RepID=UPI002DDC7B07|nr:glycerophosphodiester phosphodiesterase family protein [Streptomyces sp. NBC_01808]WSA37155.1 glycerophosphodiester phosphodiesterase family protein [Streptomyces sp. NBC_01808]
MPSRTLTRASGALTALAGLVLTAAATSATATAAEPAADSDSAAPIVTVAHRGASADAPENTLAAIDTARDMGIDWVENDVQRSKDGKLVIMHDDTLARTTNVEEVFPDRAPWKVSDFTWKEIRTLDAGSWKGEEWAGTRVPTLDQYMKRVTQNQQKLVLEIKKPELYPGIEKEILSELRNLGWLSREHVKNRLVVQSFGADSIKTVHELRPDVKTGFLGAPAVADLPEYATFSDQINSNHGTMSAEYYAAVHALKGPHGKQLESYTWTVDDPARAVQLAEWGADGIITNKPDLIAEALADAGFGVAAE